jgi:hypothetical protein
MDFVRKERKRQYHQLVLQVWSIPKMFTLTTFNVLRATSVRAT